MQKNTAAPSPSTPAPSATPSPLWATLEAYARAPIQTFVQRLLEEEVEAVVGRAKSERRAPDAPPVYRNGHGKPRRLALTSGTVTVRRPRVRNLDARFERRVLPRFKRRTQEVGALLPELYLHGLSTGDVELALRGLAAPKLTVADGHLGIWSALAQVWPESAEPRCWNHTLRNVVDAVPEKAQAEVTAHVQRIAAAASCAAAERERRRFRLVYQARHPKAVERLERAWERLVAYDAFPEAHWRHLRTTNVVESPFAVVRLRTSAAKRFTRVEHATALIWRLLLVAERHFRKLNAPHRCAEVYAGVAYADGQRVATTKPSPDRPEKAAA